jgi:hypothetical protein
MAITPSQGFDFAGIGGLTSAKVKYSRPDPWGQRLESSTLDLEAGDTRTYELGLTDGGPSAPDGITVVATLAGMSGTAPSIGDVVTYDGFQMRCTDSEEEDAVGELHKWSATFSTFTPAGS